MSDISWDGIDSYRIPEFNPRHIEAGAAFTYVTKEHLDIPSGGHREALIAAIKSGTAKAMKVDTFVCQTCGTEKVVAVRPLKTESKP